MNQGYLCNTTIDIAEKSGVRSSAFLKNSAILYDRIFFDRARPKGMIGLDYSVPEIVSGWAEPDPLKALKLQTDRRFYDIFPPVEEILDLSSHRYIHNYYDKEYIQRLNDRMLPEVASLMASAYKVPIQQIQESPLNSTWRNIPAFVSLDFLNLSKLVAHESNLKGIFSAFHFAVSVDTEHMKKLNDPIYFDSSKTGQSDFPDFSLLSWEEIFELRNDPSIVSFRTWVHQFSSNNGVKNVDNAEMAAQFVKSLKENYQRTRAKPLNAILRGVGGNIPILPLNPLSLLFSAVEIKKEFADFNDFNWIHFVHETDEIMGRNNRVADNDHYD